jgi:photosystem II stability/assembly factor-like uncharacterized protein
MDQIPRCRDDLSVIGRRGNRDSTTAAKVEQPLIAKLPQCTQDRVRVHGKHCGKVPRRRQPFAWAGFTLSDGTPDLRRDLLVEIGRLLAVHLDTEHGASDTSFTEGQRLSVLTPRPPGPPRHDEPPDVEALEALIEEARRRARRRRRLSGVSALVAAAAVIGYFGFNNGGSTSSEVGREEAPVAPSVSAQQDVKPAGIEGGSIWALAVAPNNNIFAATINAGVFKSANGGTSWRPLTIAPSATRVDSLAVAPGEPQTVYAGAGGGIFKSTDGGATWQAANGGLFDEETTDSREHRMIEGFVYSLVVDPRDPETVYAGTWAAGLLKTTNGGASWQRLDPGLIGSMVLDPNDPETIYVGSVGAFAAGAESGVSKSTDGGRTWQPAGLSGTNVVALAVDPEHPEILYAGTAKGLLKTSDGGNTWRAGGLKGSVSGVKIDPERPTTLYAATSSGVHKSTDGGRTWRALGAGREGREGVNALALDPQNPATLYAGTGAGVLKSTDSGRTWEVSTAGMTGVRVDDLAAPTRDSAYAISSQGLLRRAGGRWLHASAGLPTLNLSALAVDPQRPEAIYVATETEALFRTTDGGKSWRRLQSPPNSDTAYISALAVDPQDGNNLYVGTGEEGDYVGSPPGVFKSTDGGNTWRAGGLEGPVWGLKIDPERPATLYAVSPTGFHKSTDGGDSWWAVDAAWEGRDGVNALALDPQDSATLYAGTDGEVFKSTDAGATWRDLDVGFGTDSVNALAVNPRARGMVYAGGDDGLFITVDGGETWRRYQGDLGRRGIEALAFNPTGHTLYVGGIRGGVVEVSLTGS